MCYIDGQKNKYSVLNECNRMLKYNIYNIFKSCTEAVKMAMIKENCFLPIAHPVLP
jgi:hypothetical protein